MSDAENKMKEVCYSRQSAQEKGIFIYINYMSPRKVVVVTVISDTNKKG